MSGISAQYVDGLEFRIKELGEQVEKLTEECVVLRASNRTKLDTIAYLETREDENKQKLAAFAEQNEKLRKALTKWRYLDSSYNWRCGYCGNEEGGEHKEGCVLSLPNLSTPVLNKYRAEGMRMAAEICEHISDEYREREGCRYPELKTDAESGASDCESSIRARAAELEKTNG